MSYSTIGIRLATDPASAFAALEKLFAKHKTREKVATALGVSYRTVGKWQAALREKGFEFPDRRTKDERKKRSPKTTAKPPT